MTSDRQVHVREHPVPGVGRCFELQLPDGLVLSVGISSDSGDRTLSVLRPGQDEPEHLVRLDEAQSLTVATLLSGIRIEFESPEPRTGVRVATTVVAAGSPASGLTLDQLETTADSPSCEDACVLAVVRDDTPELLENDPARPVHPGDRLVLAGKAGALDDLRRWLAG